MPYREKLGPLIKIGRFKIGNRLGQTIHPTGISIAGEPNPNGRVTTHTVHPTDDEYEGRTPRAIVETRHSPTDRRLLIDFVGNLWGARSTDTRTVYTKNDIKNSPVGDRVRWSRW